MDRTQTIDRLEPGHVHRVRSVVARAGGKSFIVARTVRSLGVEVSMYGFLGGPVGAIAAEECRDRGIDDRHTPIAGSTRITPVIVEVSTGRSTVLNEPGPEVTEAEIKQLRAKIAEDVLLGDLVVCTGSLPPGLPSSFYADVAELAHSRGARLAVDASRDVLRHALAAAPWLVKCNRSEFADATGCAADGHDEAALRSIASAMVTQIERGSSIVIVTMGSAAFVVATADGLWQVAVPQIEAVNATGSGDTFLACFMASVADGCSLSDSLRMATAGGVVNAGQLTPGLDDASGLVTFAAAVSFAPLLELNQVPS
ncbi:1-phosphofructokinase family hexose kinase [Okibacterium sp. HSC-33S16]|nr:1-phosphofructokinase family hexose kinase [Okibacterium sp. HSC-33S16]